jgi:beta-phosphoglucomutase-like phosphatase (HAD superfamily)
MKLRAEDAVVVENAPLGVKAANNANIDCFVVLNNTPLARFDFNSIILQNKIFEKTSALRKVIEELCK